MKKSSIYLTLSFICFVIALVCGIWLYNDPESSMKKDVDQLIKKGKAFVNDVPSLVKQTNQDEVIPHRKNKKSQYLQSKNKTSNFSCDGRQYCREMRSCEEAIFFIRNCPNTKMDGDRDGKPCEDWCGH